MIIIDPPYGKVTKEKWDKNSLPFSYELVGELYRVLINTGSIYIWCGIGEKSQSLINFYNILKQSQFYFKDLITWKKQRGIGMRKGWLYTREEILWYVKDNKKFIWNKEEQYSNEKRTFTATYKDVERMEKYMKSVKSEFKRITNVWEDIRETNISWNKKEINTTHLTPKPVEALERIIKVHTKETDIVLDCFIGSGTTVIACINTNRNFIGIELEQKYVDIANQRIAEKLASNIS